MSESTSSTPEYVGGYAEEMKRIISRRTAATHAAYLLPHLNPGMTALDVGCGPGTISIGLAKAVEPGEFHGLDMEPSQIELAREAAFASKLTNAHFQVGDALRLPFPDDHFDALHCHAVLMHIPDTRAALTEFVRVLKPGGVLGAREYILDSLVIEPDVGNISGIAKMYSSWLSSNGGHPQMGQELRRQFSEVGLEDIQASGAYESFGNPADVTACAGFLRDYFCGPAIGDRAVANGIVSQDDINTWRTAALEWGELPGAFSAWAEGEATGRKRH